MGQTKIHYQIANDTGLETADEYIFYIYWPKKRGGAGKKGRRTYTLFTYRPAPGIYTIHYKPFEIQGITNKLMRGVNIWKTTRSVLELVEFLSKIFSYYKFIKHDYIPIPY